jgi:wobble nucleotide-excising tRNase
MSANFRGSAPRSEYGLLLRNKPIPLEGGAPTFATALSEGDKRTLAFAFFVASTLADPKLAQRIVVIDDPMCSLDANRKHHTRSVLKSIYNGAEQLIVLAHDLHFIQDTRNALFKSDSTAKISIFQLGLSANDYSDFAKLDIDETCESAYFRHHRLLNDFVSGNGSDPREVAKAIRPMLEEYLHLRFPRLIGKNLLFGEVVKRIRDAVAPSPLCHAANLVEELNSVNDYACQFHHGTNPVTVNAFELKAYVDRALAIIHKGA